MSVEPEPPVALLAEGVDRNFHAIALVIVSTASPSSRRAWIEISGFWLSLRELRVALLAEGVDRNLPSLVLRPVSLVALLAEGVDRNTLQMALVSSAIVALLAEGVDRNSAASRASMSASRSPSSRRAWIEI